MQHKYDEFERLLAGVKPDVVPDVRHRKALHERVLAEYAKSQATISRSGVLWSFNSFWRWIMARPIYRLGIPTILIVFLGSVAFLTVLPTKTGFALEQLIEPLLSAKSGRCQIVIKLKDKNLPPFAISAMFRGTAHRQESKDLGTVMIMDSAAGTIVTLTPKAKQAQILQQINRDPAEPVEGGFLQQMRDQLAEFTDDKRVTQRISLGDRELADKKLVGYRVIGTGGQMEIWGDPTTGLPHSVVSNLAAFPNMEMTMTDFEFDVDFDDELFSLTPPSGYNVTRDTMDMSLRSEAGLLAALKQFAEINDGVYPNTINAMVGIEAAHKYHERLAERPAAEQEQEVNRVRKLLAAGLSFPLHLSVDSDAAYAGKGVHRDEGAKPIFWYKPEGSTAYRVVAADLSVSKTDSPPQDVDAQRFAATGENRAD